MGRFCLLSLLLFCLCSPTVVASMQSVEVLKEYLIETARKDGKKLVLPLKSVSGKYTPSKLLSIDEKGILADVQGARLDLSWQMIGKEGLYKMCSPLLDRMPGKVLAAFLKLGARLGFAGTKVFERNKRALWVKDPKAAKALEHELKGISPDAPGSKNGNAGRAVAKKKKGSLESKIKDWWGFMTDGSGHIRKQAYRRTAARWNAQAIDNWHGPDYRWYTSQGVKRNEKFPDVWVRPLVYPPKGRPYHLGNPGGKGHAFTEGQLVYAPSSPGDPGMDRVFTWAYSKGVYRIGPQKRTHPEPGVTQPAWHASAGRRLGLVADSARALGNRMWAIDGLFIFRSGVVGSAGTGTAADTYPYFKFPSHKVPVAITITNRNEFALVCIWDTKTCKGQVAVLALAAYHTKGVPAWWAWRNSYPGMFNIGDFREIHLLGYIDLPEMATPTDISAVGDNRWAYLFDLDKGAQIPAHIHPENYIKFSEQRYRDAFYNAKGCEHVHSSAGNKDIMYNVARCGFAVVVSKFEKKAVFIDLQPLFQYYREMYFTGAENYKKTRDLGKTPGKWPYSFDYEKKQKPRVIGTLRFDYPCTAVKAEMPCRKDSWVCIATLDGTLHYYRVGNLGSEQPAGRSDVRKVAVVKVGRNPCSLGYVVRKWFLPPADSGELMVVCRGDRAIYWVKMGEGAGRRIAGNNARVLRVLRDKKLADPVHAEQAMTAMCDLCPFINVCDFRGQKLVSYRTGKARFGDGMKKEYGMGPDGKAGFEICHAMAFPGFPYRICTSNLP